MPAQTPPAIDNEKNRAVLEFIAPLSCHGDIVEPLRRCLHDYDDVVMFCPAPADFSYVLWYVGDVVFAFATGMREVALRIGGQGELHGRPHRELAGWTSFPYDSDALCRGVRLAHDRAIGS